VKTTFHLAPLEVWTADRGDAPYVATSLATEGFIHCTDGVATMVATANRFYAADPRPFVVLTIDLDALDVPWRYDEPDSPFPHVYGPIVLAAIRSATPIPRAPDGRFLPFEA
jgi:uncharacterized protein (DUF952 family)